MPKVRCCWALATEVTVEEAGRCCLTSVTIPAVVDYSVWAIPEQLSHRIRFLASTSSWSLQPLRRTPYRRATASAPVTMFLAIQQSCQQHASGQRSCGNWAFNLWTWSPERTSAGKAHDTATPDSAASLNDCSIADGRTISPRTPLHCIPVVIAIDAAPAVQRSSFQGHQAPASRRLADTPARARPHVELHPRVSSPTRAARRPGLWPPSPRRQHAPARPTPRASGSAPLPLRHSTPSCQVTHTPQPATPPEAPPPGRTTSRIVASVVAPMSPGKAAGSAGHWQGELN